MAAILKPQTDIPRTDQTPRPLQDGLQTVKDEHQHILQLFRSYKATHDKEMKLSLSREIVTTVSRHASAEERYLYPLITAHVAPAQGSKLLYDMMVMDDQVNKDVLHYLDTHVPQSDQDWQMYDRVMGKFMMIEEDHLNYEEIQVLDLLSTLMTPEQKDDFFQNFQKGIKDAPLHPHPAGGTTGIAAKFLHPMAGVVDKMGHAMQGVANMMRNPKTGKEGTATAGGGVTTGAATGETAPATIYEGHEKGKQHDITDTTTAGLMPPAAGELPPATATTAGVLQGGQDA